MNLHILGGGIGGMAASLHLGRLREQGHLPASSQIHLYDAADRLGGKASSQFGRPDAAGMWPGEHGFRFFPNFYRCMPDTLKLIPLTPAHRAAVGLRDSVGPTAFDALLASAEGGMGTGGRIVRISRAPSQAQVPITVKQLLDEFRVSNLDMIRYTAILTRFLSTCHDRALRNWEHKTLDDFVTENGFSPPMQDFLRSLRALSAMRANRGSLRTLLFTSVQLLADFDPEFHLWDALLPGPTDHLLLQPWQQELERLGVQLHLRHTLTALAFAPEAMGVPGRLTSARLATPTGGVTLDGDDDVYVLAVPWEVAKPLLVEAPNLPSTLAGVREIEQRADNLGDGAEPMVGVQFWLKKDVPMVQGHMVYPGAPWALTSVSQAQFWRPTYARPLEEVFEAPGLQGVLSAIVSAWDAVAPSLGKAPMHCTAEEIARETLNQITTHSGVAIAWSDVIAWHVDSDIRFTAGGAHCPTPLWVSPAGSWLHRPLPDPGCGNFFLASDWARTETDVGSMESAEEAARWSVRAIARSLPVPPPESSLPDVRRIRLWPSLEAARAIDQWLFDHGLGHVEDLEQGQGVALRELFTRAVGGEDVTSSLGPTGRPWNLHKLPGDLLGKARDLFSRFGRSSD